VVNINEQVGWGSPTVLAALHQAGWTAGRTFDTASWHRVLEGAGFFVGDAASSVWSEFGNLTIRSAEHRVPASSLRIDPVDACIDSLDEVRKLESELSVEYSPLGMWSIQFRAYIDANGSVIAVGPRTIWRLGATFVEALDYVVNGDSGYSRETRVDWL
jgi:SUKH-3 immunity protein